MTRRFRLGASKGDPNSGIFTGPELARLAQSPQTQRKGANAEIALDAGVDACADELR